MSDFSPRLVSDEYKGFRDVLAFIEDFNMEDFDATHNANELMDEGIATSHQWTSDIQLPVPAVVKPSKLGTNPSAIKTTRRRRVSRKEELHFLRKKVAEMEDKLKALQEGDESSPPPMALISESEKATIQLKQSTAIWKMMAKRQKSERELAESENRRLREELRTQVRMAKSLQKIFYKQDRAFEQIAPEIPMQLKHRILDDGIPGTFDQLIGSLDALYARTNERISLCPEPSKTQPKFQEQNVKCNDLSSMFVELVRSELLPFTLDTVNRVIWRHTTERGMKFSKYFEEYFAKRTDDTLLRKFGIDIKQDERVAKISGRQAIRRHDEGHRIVIVRSSLIDRVELPGTRIRGFALQDIGWVVIKAATGEASLPGPMTSVLTYSTVTPVVDFDFDSQWDIAALTAFVLRCRRDIENANDRILENLLIQEAANESFRKK